MIMNDLSASVTGLTRESKCMDVLTWATLNGFTIPFSKAALMSNQASCYCLLKSIEIGTVKDERHGLMTTYPEYILDLLFKAE
jgi:hypothetical protein